jgi:hypothetical protein
MTRRGVVRGAHYSTPASSKKWMTCHQETGQLGMRDLLQGDLEGSEDGGGSELLASASAMVTVFGAPGSGKSTIMNHIGQSDSFRRQCDTKGADVDVVAMAGGHQVALVDTEGHYQNTLEYDVSLFTPMLLCSNVLMFNWNGGFRKDSILDSLSVILDVLVKLDAEDLVGMVGMDGKGETTDDSLKPGGHLHILLRDSAPSDRLYDMLLGAEEDAEGPDADPGAAKRNDTRNTLFACFSSVTVWGVPAPKDSAAALMESFELEECKAPYRQQVEAIRGAISAQVAGAPKCLAGRALEGPSIFKVASEVVQELNIGDGKLSPLADIVHRVS